MGEHPIAHVGCMKFPVGIALALLPLYPATAEKVPEGFLLLHVKDHQLPADSKIVQRLEMKKSSKTPF